MTAAPIPDRLAGSPPRLASGTPAPTPPAGVITSPSLPASLGGGGEEQQAPAGAEGPPMPTAQLRQVSSSPSRVSGSSSVSGASGQVYPAAGDRDGQQPSSPRLEGPPGTASGAGPGLDSSCGSGGQARPDTQAPAGRGRELGSDPARPAGSKGLSGAEFREAWKRTRSQQNAARTRRGQTYTPAAKRTAGSRYAPGMNRGLPETPRGEGAG